MNGWKSLALSEVMQLEYGKPLPPEDRNPTGLYPAYGANGEKDRTDRFLRDQPSIIVGRKGSAGEITLTEDKYWPLDVTYFAEFDRDSYDLNFLFYLLMTLGLPRLAKGVKPGINRNEIYAIPVMVPTLPEQRRIVAILDEAFEGIAIAKANAEKNLRNARELFESARDSVFTNQDIRWIDMPLVDVCDLINGRAYKREEMLTSGKYPLLRVGNFFTNKDWFYSDLELDPEKYCDKGDLLYAWSASFGPRIWEGDKVIYHYHIWKVIPKGNVVEKRFLLHLLDWDVAKIKEAHGTGTTMMHVGKGSMEARIVPVAPLRDQQEIVKKLDFVADQSKQLKSVYERKLAELDALKKSLLNQAFSGQLTAKVADKEISEVA